MGFRITILIGAFSLLYALLFYRLYNVQLEKGEYYKAKAASIHRLSRSLLPERGKIYFTDKEANLIPAAISKEYPTIFAIPSQIQDLEETAKFLSELTGEDENSLKEILGKKDDPYEPILRKATAPQVKIVVEKNLGGVSVDYEPARFYPLSSGASHLLGFVAEEEDWNSQGRYGIELYYDDKLRGIKGISRGDEFTSPQDGEDIYLTIDRNIQVEAERILNRLVEERRASGGTVIVEDPKTGKILAMSSRPTFNPNEYNKAEIKTFLNPSVQSVYEPGSIFKVITMVAGLEAGKITPETTYYDNGYIILNGKKIENWDLNKHGPYGKINMTNVLEHSVNTGAAFAEKTLGHDLFYNYLVKFGLKKKSGIDLPGEVVGNLSPLERNVRDINFATASFGQGISVTPMALINALSAIANKGLMMKPYLNTKRSPQVVGRIVSEKASREVIQMMVSAVEKAEIARIRGYTVAGKTGTAEVPDFERGGYTEEVINTYIGFAPAYDAKFTILIRIDKPVGAPLAGLTVVPAFRDLASFILNYYNIPPDNLNNN